MGADSNIAIANRRRERFPKDGAWRPLPNAPVVVPGGNIVTASGWQSGLVRVISALELAELPDRSGVGPQWHVSISRAGKRPKPTDVRRALRAFGMVGAEEDNHHPGNARHFWLVVDPAHRVDCECKEDEITIVEPDGYKWTNPPDAAACRGCEFEQTIGTPCPLHHEAAHA